MGDMKRFGDKLRRQLKGRKATQSEVAKAVGVDESTFSKWLEGAVRPRNTHLLGLARYFDVTTDYFLDDAIPVEDDGHNLSDLRRRALMEVVDASGIDRLFALRSDEIATRDFLRDLHQRWTTMADEMIAREMERHWVSPEKPPTDLPLQAGEHGAPKATIPRKRKHS